MKKEASLIKTIPVIKITHKKRHPLHYSTKKETNYDLQSIVSPRNIL